MLRPSRAPFSSRASLLHKLLDQLGVGLLDIRRYGDGTRVDILTFLSSFPDHAQASPTKTTVQNSGQLLQLHDPLAARSLLWSCSCRSCPLFCTVVFVGEACA